MPSNRRNPRQINHWLDRIQQSMKDVYKNTYYTDDTNTRDMNRMMDSIEGNIGQIMSRNSGMDLSGISRLYAKSKLNGAALDGDLSNKVRELFEDNPLTDELLSSYLGNKWIRDLDDEIDVVLKYCTKMREALELLRDAVLSADSFSKDFINPKSPFSGDDNETALFESRSQAIIKKYKLQQKTQEWYDEASKHGEQFLYIVPYKKAISRLLNNKNQEYIGMVADLQESTIMSSDGKPVKKYKVDISDILNESAMPTDDPNEQVSQFTVEIDTSRTLRSVIAESKKSHDILQRDSRSINEDYGDKSLDISLPDDLEVPKTDTRNSIGADGLVYRGKKGDHVKPTDLKVRGALVKRLKRENIIPLYIEDDICLGYYYMEFDKELQFDFYTSLSDRYGDGRVSQGIDSSTRITSNVYQDQQIDEIIMKISASISKKLDKTFVNSNQDLTKEIYAVLKSNEIYSRKYKTANLKISFLPEEDVCRLAFNIDPDSHRGVSDCAAGLIPAKLFACLYITNVIGILTRGQDKRVYYVKQTVDTNISQTLLNVINQIKKSNFGIRQIESINSILNITGRFNDYVIPVGPGGDSPVQFEVMPGQEFEPYTDLMNTLEEMAVNSTNCPIELVQSRMSPDFATQFTSSSIKVLRFVYGRQGIVQDFLSEVLTKIYRCEYEEFHNEIDVELPPPLFLVLTNTSQMLQNAQEQATLIAEMEYEGDTSEDVDRKKAIFKKKYVRWLMSAYMKASTTDKLKKVAEMESAKEREIKDGTSEM